jgi:hypothetical protein
MIALLLALSLVAQAGERITEIRVHGNHTTPDADIIAMSGLVVGQPFVDTTAAESESRLRATDRFAGVAVQRRFLSIADPSQILVMIVVDERAAVTEGDLTPGPMRRVRAAGMWMPILSYADGYGFTYGARIAFVEPLGRKSRLSVPLTWGGERRVGAELERTFEHGPFSAGRGSVAASRRVNPHFDVEDERIELRLRGERALTSWLRAGGAAGPRAWSLAATPTATMRSGPTSPSTPASIRPSRATRSTPQSASSSCGSDRRPAGARSASRPMFADTSASRAQR